ncbi:unnamed protein product, partial [Agarophyton chilense]
CAHVTPRAAFTRAAFNATSRFVRLGVPSPAVDALFRRALLDVLQRCSCASPHLLDALCVRLRFTAAHRPRTLEALLSAHAAHFFPLYDADAPLTPLSPLVAARLTQAADELVAFVAPIAAVHAPNLIWNAPVFPSHDHLFRPSPALVSSACARYRTAFDNASVVVADASSNEQRFVSAKDSVAYALAVVQVVRYANGDVPVATALLNNHTRFVYAAALCLHKSGPDLPVPTAAVLDVVRHAKLLISTALHDLHNNPGTFLQFYQYYLPAPAHMENIHAIGEPALRMFRPLVQQLASIASAGNADTYMDFTTSRGKSVTVRLTQDLLAATNPYEYFEF